MEKWDLFNKNRQSLNRTICRDDNMMKNEYHIVVNIWTINNKKEVLLTFRHPNKKLYPNKWECTGGNIFEGEKSKACAVRELKEETGIDIFENELIFLGTRREEYPSESENLFVDIYAVIKDIEIDSLELQENETTKAKLVTIETLNEMIDDKSIAENMGQRLKSVYTEFEKVVKETKGV